MPEFAPLPTASLMHAFCISKVVKQLPPSLRTVRKGTVTQVEPAFETGQGGASGCRVHLSDGEVLVAKAVVVATSHGTPILPPWARDLNSNNISAPLGLCTWDGVDLSSQASDIKGKRVVIVGGGMTAATQALGAAACKAGSVTLIARRPLVCQPFECEVGWWGNKRLQGFWHAECPEEKMKQCRRARLRGTLNKLVWDALAAAVAHGVIHVLEGVQVSAAAPQTSTGGVWHVHLEKTAALQPPPAPANTAFQQAVAALKPEGSGSSPPPQLPVGVALVQEQALTADAIWIACGSAFNASTHPLLSGALQTSCPTRLVAGYPVLDPDSCLWPGAPVYLIGRSAMLAVGPSAGDLAGMRLAADRIAQSLKRAFGKPSKFVLTLDDDASTRQPEWIAVADKLRKQLSIAEESGAADAPGPAPSSTVSLRAGVWAGGAWQLPVTIDEDGYLALEEEGRMLTEPKVRASVTRPVHLIDISDLDPCLPRHEVQRFSFTDDEFDVCVALTLPEAVCIDDVRTLVTERSMEVWAVGREGAYHLHVPRLYGRVLPPRTKVKVNEKRKKVYVTMHKETDAEWTFLKG